MKTAHLTKNQVRVKVFLSWFLIRLNTIDDLFYFIAYLRTIYLVGELVKYEENNTYFLFIKGNMLKSIFTFINKASFINVRIYNNVLHIKFSILKYNVNYYILTNKTSNVLTRITKNN